MNYAAINTKVKAISAKESTSQSAAALCLYITDKTLREFITAIANKDVSEFHYYINQWKRLSRLDKKNQVALRGALGAEIDMNNILWMYRLKKYHRIKGDATYGYLVPIRYKLSPEMTQKMAHAESPAALLDEIAGSPYARDIDFAKPALEQQLSKAIEKRYQAAARRYPESLAPVLAYLHKLR
ncbi:MAG: V-type ATPase subunit [Defluviitaleaceae bacterium]|nr:V-type ATPase subunit [Defluviitaleaceae bacterium]